MKDRSNEPSALVAINRRGLLAGAGSLLLAPTAGLGAVEVDQARERNDRRAPDPGSGESRAIARHVVQTRFDELPAEAALMTKRSVLDAIGVSMAATRLEPACGPYLDLALQRPSDEAVVMGTGKRTDMMLAALGNGALAHALDYEDAHEASFTHPNAATVAAAVSVADALGGVSGKEFAVAVALGCDLVCRLSLARGDAGVPPTAFYPPAIAGTFGAAAAASRLLGLTEDQTLSAFSLALCMNSCSAQTLFDAYSDVRAVREGFCAQAGVQAALLAKRDVKGYERPFEGRGGFFTMYSGGLYLPGVLTRALGERFEGQFVAFKAWPACRASHVYIQSILEGLERAPVDADRIARIRAYVKESDMIVCEPAAEKRRPRAAIDAKFSLYFTVAAALVQGKVDLASFTAEALTDRRTLALADKVEYVIDEKRARPAADGGGPLLTIQLDDGSERNWGVERPFGSPEYPMSERRLVRKFVDCGLAARKTFDEASLTDVAGTILALETVSDMREVTRLL